MRLKFIKMEIVMLDDADFQKPKNIILEKEKKRKKKKKK